MRAMVVPEYGPPEVFELRDVPAPRPGPGQVLIDVQFASVNFSDVRNRRGDGLGRPPMIVGIEVSGRVAELGSGVSGLIVGQQVASLCGGSGYAEQVAVDADRVLPLPDDLFDDPAGACATGVVATAINLLLRAGRVRPGESVLLHGAAGGVGSVFAQVALYFGVLTVFGTVGSAEKVGPARASGYEDVFLREGFVEAARAATDGRGVDVIFDPIGGSTRAASWEALARFGRLVHFGNASMEPEVVPDATVLRAGGFSYVGYSGGQDAVADLPAVRASWEEGLRLVADSRVDIPIHAVLALEEAATAHRLLEGGTTTGKLVLRVS